jgi:hypothetical protein
MAARLNTVVKDKKVLIIGQKIKNPFENQRG